MKTKIEWTDLTINYYWGCYGNCKYCYARNISKMFAKQIATIETKHRYTTILSDSAQRFLFNTINKLNKFEPTFLSFNYNKKLPKKPKRIFVNSMSDIVFWKIEHINLLIRKMASNPQHEFQILTKFPGRLINMDLIFPDNVLVGVTITKSRDIEEKLYYLKQIKAKYYFISFEPIFEPIYYHELRLVCNNVNIKIDWIIIGVNSNKNANKKINILTDLILQNDIPVFVKSMYIKETFTKDVNKFIKPFDKQEFPIIK